MPRKLPPRQPESHAPVSAGAAARVLTLRPGWHPAGYDPWLEIFEDAFRNNARETSRLAGGTPILAVIKNNAYGLGDQLIAPVLDSCEEVAGIACTRVSEALAMRAAGVRKPILNMAETSEEEMIELARHGVHSSVWLDDAPAKIARASRKLRAPVPVHLYLDAGMGREGMPDHRARPWVESICASASAKVEGTYMMFGGGLQHNPEQLERFRRFTGEASAAGLNLGRLHASSSFEVLSLPEARFDMVRPGTLLFGHVSTAPVQGGAPQVQPVFRLCARISRLERLRPGDSASFGRAYIATKPTWIALLPIGHTDGYPAAAARTCQVRIRGRLYPVVSVVSSAHTIVEIGDEKTVEVGDTATLIGPEDPAISPHAVAANAGMTFYSLVTKMSLLLPRMLVRREP